MCGLPFSHVLTNFRPEMVLVCLIWARLAQPASLVPKPKIGLISGWTDQIVILKTVFPRGNTLWVVCTPRSGPNAPLDAVFARRGCYMVYQIGKSNPGCFD